MATETRDPDIDELTRDYAALNLDEAQLHPLLTEAIRHFVPLALALAVLAVGLADLGSVASNPGRHLAGLGAFFIVLGVLGLLWSSLTAESVRIQLDSARRHADDARSWALSVGVIHPVGSTFVPTDHAVAAEGHSAIAGARAETTAARVAVETARGRQKMLAWVGTITLVVTTLAVVCGGLALGTSSATPQVNGNGATHASSVNGPGPRGFGGPGFGGGLGRAGTSGTGSSSTQPGG